ncbi:TIGR02679 family protein [Bacillus sp. V3B]|uniref:TIGR02679 family protein n=1 Tax=Bacillus sp. V3B TaxID=2804915 RepID=UPI0021094F17|nr:TIGR02679 family protein [Bacillus sp. V3B]MCQ6274822.1 TIGR02679 family protein [Bacillus sp. V3B]
MKNRIQVFSEEPGFLKLFTLFKEKYRSLGRIGGNISLKTFSRVELQSIAGFLGQPSEKLLEKGSMALLDFERELSNTGFSNYTLLQLLEEVLQESISTKKEEIKREREQEDDFIDSLKQVIPKATWWLQWIRAKTPDTRWIWSLYKQDKEELYERVIVVFKAFTSLPKKGEFERLPFFSQRITGNPHDFDTNELAGKLLLHCMYVDQVLHGNKDATMPRNMEELNDLFAQYGIMRDDLWNFVTCQGLLAQRENIIHPVWQAAIHTGTVMNVPMKELAKVDRIWPCNGFKVWIVENSSVCSTIMDAVPNAPVICTHGQLRLASWVLLDRLAQSNCTLFYSGDCDPEGLVIAQRLKQRYKDRVVLWRMDRESYESSLSNEDISNRLSKLDHISSEWNELISLMRNVKKAGYQEAIVSSLISDIKQETRGQV